MSHPGNMLITLISIPPFMLSFFLNNIDLLVWCMNSSEFSFVSQISLSKLLKLIISSLIVFPLIIFSISDCENPL